MSYYNSLAITSRHSVIAHDRSYFPRFVHRRPASLLDVYSGTPRAMPGWANFPSRIPGRDWKRSEVRIGLHIFDMDHSGYVVNTSGEGAWERWQNVFMLQSTQCTLTTWIAKWASKSGLRTLDQSTPLILRYSAWGEGGGGCEVTAAATADFTKMGKSTAVATACGSFAEMALLRLDLITEMDDLGNDMSNEES